MSERPILFKSEMVRAISDGRKTQTRRIVNMDKLQATVRGSVRGDFFASGTIATGRCKAHIAKFGAVSVLAQDGKMLGVKPEEFDFNCPYADGRTLLQNMGNLLTQWIILPDHSRLWVKETFAIVDGEVITKADCGPLHAAQVKRWKPSIFMPRAASRITLEVESVEVERLQEISEGDAIAEGWPKAAGDFDSPAPGNGGPFDWYRNLWESINGPGSWDANPWVWVIAFRV